MTDPTSVVRESEYARTPENVPIINRMFGAIDKLKSGGAGLTNADREALVIGAKIVANERGKRFKTDVMNTLLWRTSFRQIQMWSLVIPSFSGFDIGGSSSSVPTIESGQQKKAVGRWNPKPEKWSFLMPIIEVNGKGLEFPDNLSPDDLNKAVSSAAEQIGDSTNGGRALLYSTTLRKRLVLSVGQSADRSVDS